MLPENNRKKTKSISASWVCFMWFLNNYALHENKIRKNINAKQNFHAEVWKVSLENTTTWKIKSSTSSLDLCAPTKLAQLEVGITVLEATKMMPKSSMTDGVHKNGRTVKNLKRCQPVNRMRVLWRNSGSYVISFKIQKEDSPGLQLFWKFYCGI